MFTDNELLVELDHTGSQPWGIRKLATQASVRELEVMAVRLRDAGDEKGAAYLARLWPYWTKRSVAEFY
jgi:hypothetical protein